MARKDSVDQGTKGNRDAAKAKRALAKSEQCSLFASALLDVLLFRFPVVPWTYAFFLFHLDRSRVTRRAPPPALLSGAGSKVRPRCFVSMLDSFG